MKKLILAGAGHAHLVALMNISRLIKAGYSVTVVSPGDYHYYSGMGPGLLSGIYQPAEARFHVRRMVEARGGAFVAGYVHRIDSVNRRVVLSDQRVLDYDILSCNMGSEVIPVDAAETDIVCVKPIENLYTAGRFVKSRLRTGRLRAVVIGGGAAGVELAGNLAGLAQSSAYALDLMLISKDDILFRHHPRMRRLALASFRRRGIAVMERVQVKQIVGKEIILDQGGPLSFDVAFNAAGIRPVPVFRDSGLPVDVEGGLLVNEYLQCVNDPAIFGGGDCISFAPRRLDRVGVYAVRQASVLYQNLMALLFGAKLQAFTPQSRYLFILNMGDGRGILYWRSCIVSGRFALLLKNHIDKKFMRHFQVSGEQNEV